MKPGYCCWCYRYRLLDPYASCAECTDAWYAAREAENRARPEWAEITLDGCCGEGGKARGLVKAEHYVVGVDNNPRCRDGYLRSGAHEFICADILDVLKDRSFMSRFTYADFSPPCQGYSTMMNCQPPEVRARYPKLIRPIQPLADALGIPFVIENVEGARTDLRNPVTYCMWMFGRETYRHRLIEAGGGFSLAPPTAPAGAGRVNKACGWPHPVGTARAGHWKPGKFVSVAGHERKEPVRRVMEIDEEWMPDREAVAEAIPWYLGFEIARQLEIWRENETGGEHARVRAQAAGLSHHPMGGAISPSQGEAPMTIHAAPVVFPD